MESALFDILSKNSNTEVGKRWDFQDISTIEEFQKRVPLTNYDVYKPYIDRMIETGENNLLNSEEVVFFAGTSGTTGVAKMFPIYGEVVPYFCDPTPTLWLTFMTPHSKISKTPMGFSIDAYSSPLFHSIVECQRTKYDWVAPIEVFYIEHAPLAMYLQLMFGMKACDLIDSISSFFITLFVTALTELRYKWRQMVGSIETGKLDQSLPISPHNRSIFERFLGGPDPDRAKKLHDIFLEAEKSNFACIIPKIWSNVKSVSCFCSGTMKSYIPTVRHYIGPNVHLLSHICGCTESGRFAEAAKPLTETSLFSLLPNIFYEFIPESDCDEMHPKTLLSNEVEVGKVYELVLTTPNGCYRYRNGDFIKVTQRSENGPLIDLHGRIKMRLVVQGYTLHEMSMEEAITLLAKETSLRIDYMVSVDPSKSSFRIWLECEDDAVFQNADKMLEEALQGIDEAYSKARKLGTIDPVVVDRVKSGTFRKIVDYNISRDGFIQHQIKLPRMPIKDEEIEKILLQNIV